MSKEKQRNYSNEIIFFLALLATSVGVSALDSKANNQITPVDPPPTNTINYNFDTSGIFSPEH